MAGTIVYITKGMDVEAHERLVKRLAAFLTGYPPLQANPLDHQLQGVSASLVIDAATAVGAWLPGVNEKDRRAFSGWVFNAVLDALPRDAVVSMEYPVAIVNDGELIRVHQFAFRADQNIIIAWGPSGSTVIDAATKAGQTFNANDFDEDGYRK